MRGCDRDRVKGRTEGDDRLVERMVPKIIKSRQVMATERALIAVVQGTVKAPRTEGLQEHGQSMKNEW